MLTRTNTLVSFRSQIGTQVYTFDVQVDTFNNVTLKNIRGLTSRGNPSCQIPNTHFQDVQDAMSLVLDLIAETEVHSGTLVFTGQTSQAGAIPVNTLNNTEYRVVYTPPDGVFIVTQNKTLTSFDAVVGVTYGSVGTPINVPFVVLVNPGQNSSYGGTLTFTDLDAGVLTVTFPSPASSASYRVVLTPMGFFPVTVTSQTVEGFTVTLGITLGPAESVDVGFDVFFG